MKTIVLGKKIENVYDVDYKWKEIKDTNGNVKTVYTDKPVITKNTRVKEWSEICSFKGEPRYNSHKASISLWSLASYNTINISENERVIIEDEIFRADLNALHLHTDKILEEIDVNKEEAESICKEQIKAFNKMMIESNDKLKSYCDLHKLDYEYTDCIELFKLVFPDDKYEIVDGVMKVKTKYTHNYGTYVVATEAIPYVDDSITAVTGTLITNCSCVDALSCTI